MMSIPAKAGSLLKRFRRAQEGQVALTFGLAAIPMFMIAGGAVDFANSNAVQTRLQHALDSAALAAASSKSMLENDRIKLAQNVFKQNWEAHQGGKDLAAKARFEVEDDAVKGEGSVKLPAAFLRLAGINTLDVESDVSISIPKGKKAEVALVLDYSWSMSWSSGGEVKYIAMRNAAKKLINALSKEAPGQVKIGLVPFAHHVRVTLPKSFVVGQSGPGSWTGCTQDRKHDYNITDSTPVKDNDDTKWNHPQKPVPGHPTACAPYQKNNLDVQPLTDDFSTISKQMDTMKPYPDAYTHVALGAEFGWHLLSPNEPFSQGEAYHDKGTQKIMVILSDGQQTEPGFGSDSREVDDANENFAAICTNAKARDVGIRVITIAFDMDDQPAAQARMKSCASDPKEDYYEPETGSDIAQVFDDIKTQIASQVFISD
jgi:hypothetical protein